MAEALITPAAAHWLGYRASADGVLLKALQPLSEELAQSAASVWVLTSGEAGMRSQALALAEALQAPRLLEWAVALRAELKLWPAPFHRFALKALPHSWIVAEIGYAEPSASDWDLPRFKATSLQALWENPAPRALIACGRRVIALALWLQSRFAPRPFLLYVQDPRLWHQRFDLIVAPIHDDCPRKAGNMVQLPLALHRVTPLRLEAAAAAWQLRLADYPEPRWGLVVGGPSRSVAWDEAQARAAINAFLEKARAAGASVLAATSRRTRAETRAWLAERLERYRGASLFYHPGSGLDNPYWAILALCRVRAVTSDSVSMLSEQVAAPGVVWRLAVGRYSKRLTRFHALWDGAGPWPASECV